MVEEGSDDSLPGEKLGFPDDSLSGPTIDDSITKAESGSQVEELHTSAAEADSEDARLRQITDAGSIPDDHAGS
jgi:hypothetical protein